jgi:DNA-binding transcriptional ArsR family regulator
MDRPSSLSAGEVGKRTRYRDKKRTPEEIAVLELAREVQSLVYKYPRFRAQLYKLQVYIRNQLQPLASKQAAILRCLTESGDPILDSEELATDTNYDDASVRAALAALLGNGAVEEVNREGKPPRRTKDGRPTDHVYYKAAVQKRSIRPTLISPAQKKRSSPVVDTG